MAARFWKRTSVSINNIRNYLNQKNKQQNTLPKLRIAQANLKKILKTNKAIINLNYFQKKDFKEKIVIKVNQNSNDKKLFDPINSFIIDKKLSCKNNDSKMFFNKNFKSSVVSSKDIDKKLDKILNHLQKSFKYLKNLQFSEDGENLSKIIF